jgi:chromosome partitioning protein
MLANNQTFVIAVLNQKGGVGKTTIATNLVHGLNLYKIPTLLIDGDPQGSARDWHEANGAQLVPCIGMDRETICEDIKSVKDSYKVIVIDGAPQIAKLAAAAIRAANLVLIPVQPSPYDVWATEDLVQLIQLRQSVTVNGMPRAAFVLSRVIKNTVLSREIVPTLTEYGIPVLDSFTSQSVTYAQTASEGKSVFYPKLGTSTQAHSEFRALVEEIIFKYLNIEGVANVKD